MLCKSRHECGYKEFVDWGSKTFRESTERAMAILKHRGNPTEIRGGRFKHNDMPMLRYSSSIRFYVKSNQLILFLSNNAFEVEIPENPF